jgi:hypothetical protein
MQDGQNYVLQLLMGIIAHLLINESAVFEDKQGWSS